MSQWKVSDELELEVLMDDVDFQERYEKAFMKMGEAEKELQKAGSLSEISGAYCEMFHNLFDDIFGEGTAYTIFEGKRNVTMCNEVYDSFIAHCSGESKRILAETQKLASKYRPKKGKK